MSPRLPWFRMWTEARTDRKLATLSDDEHRVWFDLLCYAAEQTGKRGIIPSENRADLSIECARGDDGLLERTVSRLVTLRILDDSEAGLTFLHFEERQYDKPSDLPEATRARKQQSRAVTRSHAESPLEESREEKRRKSNARESAVEVLSTLEPVIGLIGESHILAFVKALESVGEKPLEDAADFFLGMDPDAQAAIRHPVAWIAKKAVEMERDSRLPDMRCSR